MRNLIATIQNYFKYMTNEHWNQLNYYEKCERSLMSQFINNYSGTITGYSFQPAGSYSTYDGFYTQLDKTVVVFEIKVRNCGIDQWPDHILEYSKYKNLKIHHEKRRYVKYINFFKERNNTYSVLLYNLNARYAINETKEPNEYITRKLMNAATFRSRNEKIYKDTVMLAYDKRFDMKIVNTKFKLT